MLSNSNSIVRDVEGPWNCGLDECWTNPSRLDLISWKSLFGEKVPMWNESCVMCYTILECEDDLVRQKNAATCASFSKEYISDWCSQDADFSISIEAISIEDRFIGPVRKRSNSDAYCDLNKYVCKQKHQFGSRSSMEISQCISCYNNGLATNCPVGFHEKRCIQSLDEVCTPCGYPIILNSTIHRYGTGSLFEDCYDLYGLYEGDVWNIPDAELEKCAFFMTPKWDRGYCHVECNTGYTVIQASSRVSELPVCKSCAKDCAEKLGVIPPECTGGQFMNPSDNNGECIPCANRGRTLPANAHWVRSSLSGVHDFTIYDWCQWSCDIGYYWDESLDLCVSCHEDMPICASFFYFSGCHNESRGSCRICTTECERKYYLSFDLWNEECTCFPCSIPVLNQTYVQQNCTSGHIGSANTVLGACSHGPCPTGQYISKNCTLYADMQCSLCTPPVHGKLLFRMCGMYADALYVSCPENKTCNGSFVAMDCPLDRVAHNGICECPRGMQYSNEFLDVCIPLTCESGTYMDKVSVLCRNCSYQVDKGSGGGMKPLSNPLIMGMDACFCPPGYFVVESSTSDMECWPCGDLGCGINPFERQSICDGFSRVEPACDCVSPPTMIAGKNNKSVDKCTSHLTCLPGFVPTSESIFEEASSSTTVIQYDLYTHIHRTESFDSRTFTMSENAVLHLQNRSILDIVKLDENHILLLSSGTKDAMSFLSVLYVMEEIIHMEDIDLAMLKESNVATRKTIPHVHKIVMHTRDDPNMHTLIQNHLKVWVALSYRGYCSEEFLSQDTEALCSGLSLLILYPRQQAQEGGGYCYSQYCFAVGLAYWGGSNFATYGTLHNIESFTFGKLTEEQDDSIYFLAGGRTILKYKLLFNAEFTSILYDDSLEIMYTLPPLNEKLEVRYILDIVSGIRCLLGLIVSGKNVRVRERPYDVTLWYWDFEYHSQVLLKEATISSSLGYYGNTFRFLPSPVYHIALIQGSSVDNALHTVDLWNRVISTHFQLWLSTDSLLLFSNFVPYTHIEHGSPVIRYSVYMVEYNVKSLVPTVSNLWNIAVCKSDHVYYANEKTCLLLFCRRTEPCGQHSYRNVASDICFCEAGHQYVPFASPSLMSSSKVLARCEPCIPGLSGENVYCPGGLQGAIECPSNTVVVKPLASTIQDCFCIPGFYKFNEYCSPCTKNTFCPYNGTIMPFFCHAQGTTELQQQITPFSCTCPMRTHGIQCMQCLDTHLCPLEDSNPPVLSMLEVQGIGPFSSYEYFKLCLSTIFGDERENAYVMYTVPKGFALSVDLYMEQQSSVLVYSSDSFFWRWLVIAPSSYLSINEIRICMGANSLFQFFEGKILVSNFRVSTYRIKQSCDEKYGQPGYWEWNGKSGNQEECTCIAGYEPIRYNPSWWGLSESALKCIPCLNGTFRPRHSTSQFCMPCSDIQREHAPYIGMSHCICRPGYTLHASSSICRTREELQTIFGSSYTSLLDMGVVSPDWYNYAHEPTTFVIMILTLGVFLVIVLYLTLTYCS